jgi:hypothetical protein
LTKRDFMAFSKRSASLDGKTKSNLDLVATYLQENLGTSVKLVGQSGDGDVDHEWWSSRRVRAAQTYLIQQHTISLDRVYATISPRPTRPGVSLALLRTRSFGARSVLG